MATSHPLHLQFHHEDADISVCLTNSRFGEVLIKQLHRDPDSDDPCLVVAFRTQCVEWFRPAALALILPVGAPPEFIAFDLPHPNVSWAQFRQLQRAELQDLRQCPAAVQRGYIMVDPRVPAVRWFRGEDWQLDVTPYQDPLPAIAERCLAR